MKTSNLFNQNLEKFSNWLKNHYIKANGQKFKSSKQYSYYMQLACADLSFNRDQFAGINQAGVLKVILKSLKNSGLFKSRTSKLQSDIISGFNAYITFKSSSQNIA
ncbi:MAG: hypothetical protein WBM13_10740 [Bacteroidia bacterium]